MPKPKRKTLPKHFEELLAAGDLDALKAVFAACDVNARGGLSKHTALGFDGCPDGLAAWLVGQGADINAPDERGNTPLHGRAHRRSDIRGLLALGADVHRMAPIGTPLHAAAGLYHDAGQARLLIAHGAVVDALNSDRLTPLELALQRCANIDIEAMALLADVLLGAQAMCTEQARAFVAQIGHRFEQARAGFNPDFLDSTSAALERLYALFDVPPAPRRVLHDGRSPITVAATNWPEQHEELWNALVPPSGPAATVQGEVVRIAGRLFNELENNGGINWDADFSKMADAFATHLAQGQPLTPAERAEVRALVDAVKRREGDARQLARHGVAWVLRNPQPLPLGPTAYRR